MSVERIERKDGSVVWRVRWRQGGRNRSKVLGRKRDAEAFDAELRRKKRTGELAALDAGKETLAEFGEEWWRLYAEPNLAATTLQVYAVLWDAHVLPRLGSYQLAGADAGGHQPLPVAARGRRCRPRLGREGDDAAARRAAAGVRVGPALIEPCPCGAQAELRSSARRRAVVPGTVETIRDWLLRRDLVRDAALVSVLAYAGLRPGEAFALTWSHVRDRTLLVEAAISPRRGR